MEAFAGVAYPFGEDGLDVHVDVFGVGGKPESAGFDVGEYALEGFDDFFGFALFYDAALTEHGGVGDGAFDVLLVHSAVEGDRGIEVIDARVDVFFESA